MIVRHRRRREKKTEFKTRFALIKSEKTRAVVRKSLNNIMIQFVEYKPDGDVTLASAVSQELKGFPTGNIPAAYLTGLLAGKRAMQKGIKEAVLDLGLQKCTKGSRLYAALKGILDAGVNIPHSKEALPSNERISGHHIAAYTNGKFTKYPFKHNEITKKFEEFKQKIISG
jgi:large subunit ribosomal protein L18